MRYLLLERLISLPAAYVSQSDGFLAAARQAAGYLDDEGVFRRFGLAIPRSTSYRPESQHEPLASRLPRDSREHERVTESNLTKH